MDYSSSLSAFHDHLLKLAVLLLVLTICRLLFIQFGLSSFSAVLNHHHHPNHQPEEVINIPEEEQDHNPHPHLHPTIAVEEELSGDDPTIQEKELSGDDPSIQEEEQLSPDDSNIQGINDKQTLRRFNAPTMAPYALIMVLGVLVLVFLNLKHGKHTHLSIANPFALLSVVGSGIAYMTFSVYSWINDRSDYRILKGVYYISCTLTFISLLMMLLLMT